MYTYIYVYIYVYIYLRTRSPRACYKICSLLNVLQHNNKNRTLQTNSSSKSRKFHQVGWRQDIVFTKAYVCVYVGNIVISLYMYIYTYIYIYIYTYIHT